MTISLRADEPWVGELSDFFKKLGNACSRQNRTKDLNLQKELGSGSWWWWWWWWWWIAFAVWLTGEMRLAYFQPGPLLEILTIANLQYAASRVWTCAERDFRLSWMKLCSSNNHYTRALHMSKMCESQNTAY